MAARRPPPKPRGLLRRLRSSLTTQRQWPKTPSNRPQPNMWRWSAPPSLARHQFNYYQAVAVLLFLLVLSQCAFEDSEHIWSRFRPNGASSISRKRQPHYERMNSTHFLRAVSSFNSTEADGDWSILSSRAPRPTRRPKTLAIYNQNVWRELVTKLTTSPKPSSITICANGGSATAGAGVQVGHHYYHVFANQLSQQFSIQTNILERGHGSRNSYHSAQHAASYFPPHEIDLLLWEFAINDVALGNGNSEVG